MDNLKVIAKIHTDFSQKFGIPRQSGLAKSAIGKIVFEKDFRDPNFIEGIDEFDYLWIIWGFSANKTNDGSTVRPPRLGGQKHMGVFATRAPYRPNNIGLSSVKLERVEYTEEKGPILVVSGVDMLDETPIYDIKPYLPYADSHQDACAGFADRVAMEIEVEFPEKLQEKLPKELVAPVVELLRQDPRPAYDKDKERSFKVAYGGYDIQFCFKGDKLIVENIV